MKKTALLIMLTVLLTLPLGSCGEGDTLFQDGKLVIPLLPIDLPIFPTDVTLDGLTDSVTDAIDDYGMSWLIDTKEVQDFIAQIEKRVRKASLEILQPGVLSIAVDNKITNTLRDIVNITSVGINLEIANDTNDYVAVPSEFKLYVGDSAAAEDFSDSVSIKFVADDVDNGQFILAPGESRDLSVDNIPHLVDALNNASSIGMGYKSLYRTADTSNGADLPDMWKEFGMCIVNGLISGSTSSCPDAKDLIGWHLTVKKLELVFDGEAVFDPEKLLSCDGFAAQFDLPLLSDACDNQ